MEWGCFTKSSDTIRLLCFFAARHPHAPSSAIRLVSPPSPSAFSPHFLYSTSLPCDLSAIIRPLWLRALASMIGRWSDPRTAPLFSFAIVSFVPFFRRTPPFYLQSSYTSFASPVCPSSRCQMYLKLSPHLTFSSSGLSRESSIAVKLLLCASACWYLNWRRATGVAAK